MEVNETLANETDRELENSESARAQLAHLSKFYEFDMYSMSRFFLLFLANTLAGHLNALLGMPLQSRRKRLANL
jgi:hypothetical protein